DQLYPTLDRSKIPGSGVGKILAEARPRSLAPPIDVWLVSGGNQRMQCLNHQESTGVDQIRRALHHSFDGFFSDQRKVRHGGIDTDIELTGRDFLIRGDAELAAASLVGAFDQ